MSLLQLPVSNSGLPVWANVDIEVTLLGAGVDGGNIVTTRNGHRFMAPSPETLSYDDDGNLVSDSRWTYRWDRENRLIAMEPNCMGIREVDGTQCHTEGDESVRRARHQTQASAIAAGVLKRKLEFAYDGGSRRIRKQVYDWDDGSSSWTLNSERRFVYDQWNLVAEVDASGDLLKSHVWGMDLSQTMQGAGGVGGLLWSTDHEKGHTHFVSYDGNGNVTAMVNASTAAVEARYDYNAFGETVLIEGGEIAEGNTFRYSTKYQDAETGLYYYGYRYYSAELGRWVNRDPIGEEGGLNLYGMVGNNPVNAIDYLGLDCILVADRAIAGTPGPFYHYALEYWKGCCPQKRKEIDIADYKKQVNYPGSAPGGFVEKDKVELLNTPGHKAWHWETAVVGATRVSVTTTSSWQYKSVGISVINYGFPSGNPTDTSAANIYDDNDGDVAAKWKEIIANAKLYKFAEQQGFTAFKNFPFSAYPPLGLGTNSNTFVREMVRLAGMTMMELGGSQPGPDRPDPDEVRFKHLANPNQPHNKPPGGPITRTY